MHEYLNQKFDKLIAYYSDRLEFWQEQFESCHSDESSHEVQYYQGLLIGLHMAKVELKITKED